MKILCVFGEHQYGDPSRGIGTEFASFVPALKTLGHEVIHFESWDRGVYSNYGALNRALLKTVKIETPDILLSVQMNYEIFIETLLLIKKETKTATICWTTDDSWKYREVSRFIGIAYHGMITTYSGVVPKYHRDGITEVLLTQWAANSRTLSEPLPASICRYPVSFVGAAHGNRKRRIAQLRNKGIHVSCFGHGWPAGSVVADQIPLIMKNSIISLNFANSKGPNQIKARTFEVPGSGGFLLTEDAPELEKFYVKGQEIDVFDDTKALIKRIKYYLENSDKRDRIAKAGFQRTRRDHTYENRMEQVVDFAIRARDNCLSCNINPITPSIFQTGKNHRLNFFLKLTRKILLVPCVIILGNERGLRAARRLVFEISWRVFGKKTFSESGLPGRMFPEL
jgi:spore maturation protein CgeB